MWRSLADASAQLATVFSRRRQAARLLRDSRVNQHTGLYAGAAPRPRIDSERPTHEPHSLPVARRRNFRTSKSNADANGVAGFREKEIESCLFRVLQEALNNGVKYSRANKIEVDLTATNSRLSTAAAVGSYAGQVATPCPWSVFNQSGDTSDQLVRSAYGANYARLVQIKTKYGRECLFPVGRPPGH
jgi:hypothetical protein